MEPNLAQTTPDEIWAAFWHLAQAICAEAVTAAIATPRKVNDVALFAFELWHNVSVPGSIRMPPAELRRCLEDVDMAQERT